MRALKNCLPCSLQVLKTNEESEWASELGYSWIFLTALNYGLVKNQGLLDLLEKDFPHPTQPNNFGNGKWRFYKFLFHLSGNINCSQSTLRKLVWAQATNGLTFLQRTYHIYLQCLLCVIESWLVLQTYCKHRHFTMHLLHLPIWFIFHVLTFCQHSSGINNNENSKLDACIGYDILVNNRTCDATLGSCSSNIASGYTQRNCYCDDWCFVYGDCCQDKVKPQGITK